MGEERALQDQEGREPEDRAEVSRDPGKKRHVSRLGKAFLGILSVLALGTGAYACLGGTEEEKPAFIAASSQPEGSVGPEAEEASGSSPAATPEAVAEETPEILGVRDIYAVTGSDVDYLEQVTARSGEEDLTDRITVECGEAETGREGVYRVAYRVENRYGVETEVYADMTVASADEIQELIGSRQIDRNRDRIVGAVNPYDTGASRTDDIEETLEYVRPALVQLYCGRGEGYSAGSGYLMEITEDTLYICSNRHVVEAGDNWDVYFYDGTRAAGKAMGCSQDYDVGVVTVETEDVPAELLSRLMTVHIDMEYWSGLNDQRIDVGLERVDREGGILHVSTGILLKVEQYFAWYDNKEHTEVTMTLEHGDSGSAVFDGYGNLIAMAYAYSCSPRRYWCVPLDCVLRDYEEITGRKVFVY